MSASSSRRICLLAELENAVTVIIAHPATLRYRDKVENLRERLERSRLQIAVLGQFKRGKSTFINALLGAPVLPSAVVPLTAIATYIQWGAVPRARVQTISGIQECTPTDVDKIRDFLFHFITEEANPENCLGVTQVDVFFPAPVLRNRTVLIDTPGVGSTFLHNTKTALQTLSESDAVLFVLSADPPISQAEIDYLRRIRKNTRIFFILNKIDYLNPEDRERVLAFLRTVLEAQQLAIDHIFSVSAKRGLEAKLAGDKDNLQASGMAEVEANLLSFLAREKDDLLLAAIQTNASDVLSQAESELQLRIRALTLPLNELFQKSQKLSDRLQAVERENRIMDGVFESEQKQLREKLEKRFARVQEVIYAQIVQLVDGDADWEAIRAAVPEIIEHGFDRAGEEAFSEVSGEVEKVLAEHQQRINSLMTDVQTSAANIFGVSFRTNSAPEPFRLAHEPYWVTEQRPATLFPSLDRAFDWILPKRLRRASQKSRFLREMEELTIRNTENLRWSFIRGLDETFRAASVEMERQLAAAITAIRSALEEAVTLRKSQSSDFRQELDRLANAVKGLQEIRQRLCPNSSAPCTDSTRDATHADRQSVLEDQIYRC
jgi:GTP-binding protein EngB required for normal cell division